MGGSLGLASGQLVTPDYAAVDNGEETSRSLNCTLVTPDTAEVLGGHTALGPGGPGDPPTCTALEKGISYHPLR